MKNKKRYLMTKSKKKWWPRNNNLKILIKKMEK